MYNWELSKIKICLWGKMLGKIEGKNRRGWQRMRCLDSTTHSTDMNLSKVWEMVKDREAWHPTVHGAAKSDTLSNWMTTMTTTTNVSREQLSDKEGDLAVNPLSLTCLTWPESLCFILPNGPATLLPPKHGIMFKTYSTNMSEENKLQCIF